MDDKNMSLTGAEWNVMEALWEHSPRTGREVADRLAETVGWSRTTALTMLGRMEKKGLVACGDEGKKKTYRPLVARADAARRETEDFLNRVYRGSVFELMTAVTEQAELTDSDIEDLYAILDNMKEWRK